MAVMKRRWLRLPFGLFFVLAIYTVLSYRTAGRLSLGYRLVAASNSTLERLASMEIGESEARKEIEDLLDGSLNNLRYPPISSSLHLLNRLERRQPRFSGRLPIHLRSPKDYKIFPEFRRALRDWFRNKRYQPQIMSELVGLVKRQIDQYAGVSVNSDHRYGSCAVVGNSGTLLKSDHGNLIDGHELVIRLNNARTEGYQRNVGSKTSLSFINSNILHLCARRETCYCHPYGENVPIIMYICQPVHFLDYTVCNASHKSPLLITDIRFDLLCTRIVKYYSLKQFTEESGKSVEVWDKFHDVKMFHYSSGMQAVMLALGICEKVSMFGFGKSPEAKHHYHTNQKAELDLHDYEAEYAFYRDLIARPEVIPFLKDSGFMVPPVVMYH